MPADDEAQASLKRGSKGLEESLAAYEAKDYEDAERKLRATLKELQGAVGAMSALRRAVRGHRPATPPCSPARRHRGGEAQPHRSDGAQPHLRAEPQALQPGLHRPARPGGHQPHLGAARQRQREVAARRRARLRGRRVPGLHADDGGPDAGRQAPAAAGPARLPPARRDRGGDAGRRGGRPPSRPYLQLQEVRRAAGQGGRRDRQGDDQPGGGGDGQVAVASIAACWAR